MYLYTEQSGCVMEITSYRVKGEKNPKSKRKCIGKILEDGSFQPNAYYEERTKKELAEQKVSELEAALKKLMGEKGVEDAGGKSGENKIADAVSSRKKSGATYALGKIADGTGVTEALEEVFGEERSREILSVAMYMTLTGCDSMDEFSYFDASHVHPYGKDISSPESSRLFASVTEAEVTKFFRGLDSIQSKAGRKGNGYYSFDSTAVSSFSENIDAVEVSKGKQDPDLMHFSIAAIHGSRSDMCAYYRLYRGNIPDIRTVNDFVAVTKEMGYPFGKVVFDKGYASWNNIHVVKTKLNAEVMLMLPSSFSSFSSSIEKVRGTFEAKSSNYIPGQEVYGCTVPDTVKYTVDGSEHSLFVYIHVYYSEARRAEETAKLHDSVEDQILSLTGKLEGGKLSVQDARDGKFRCDHKRCISVRRTGNSACVFEKNPEEIDAVLRNKGYFCILTTEAMKADEAIRIYRGRDGVERVFNVLKNDIGFDRAAVKTNETLEGKVFCAMIATMLVCAMRKGIRENRAALTRKMTLSRLLHELECIYTYQTGKKTVWSEISERQNLIFKCLSVEPPVHVPVVKKKKERVSKKTIK